MKKAFVERWTLLIIICLTSVVSIFYYLLFLGNGLGLSYNDARSHLDIGRRVVEGLKPGLAQLGSVWLPLLHILMIPTIWNDTLWHTGFSGSIVSMISFIAVSICIYLFLKQLGVSNLGRIVAVCVFVFNLNVLYLQSIAMTELLLIATMTLGAYELTLWYKNDKNLNLIKSSFWIMLSTLVRYDGWFLLIIGGFLVFVKALKKYGIKTAEGMLILFLTLGGFGIFVWFLWNQLIFNDALYFILGPFSAHSQQDQLSKAGVLATKGNLWLSLKIYLLAAIYNTTAYVFILGFLGAILFWFDKKISKRIRLASLSLVTPFIFNVLALFLGFSVLFIQGISGNSWFNVRYGILVMPAVAIFIGYLIDRLRDFRFIIIGSIIFVVAVAFLSRDGVTIDDARVGSSQKNVSEVSSWLYQNAKDKNGYILISAASHDAIIFSSNLPMKRFIHEGTGAYWESATVTPDHWARWIIMRTYDVNDLTWKSVSKSLGFKNYTKVKSFPFADIYELNPEFVNNLNEEI